jgi:mRNA interferase RelE/StbE
MKTRFEKTYTDDLKNIVDKTLKQKIKQAVLAVENAKTIGDIPKLRKLKGHKPAIYYRIRVGRYRIGVTIVGDLVTFARCLPRKIFYKNFP